MCEYCEKKEPLLYRNSKKVFIEISSVSSLDVKSGERSERESHVMKMMWRSQNGRWHMEWTAIRFCPMCGRDLKGGA